MNTATTTEFDILLARQQAVRNFQKRVLDLILADQSLTSSGYDRLLDAAFRQIPDPPLPSRKPGDPAYLGLGFGKGAQLVQLRGKSGSVAYQLAAPNRPNLPVNEQTDRRLTPEYHRIMSFVLKWEGSKFTDDPADRGGPTRYGVIQERYNQYRKANKLPIQSVRFIARPEVDQIYSLYYWTPVKGWLFHPKVGAAVMDFGVNSGPSRSIKYLQWSLNHKQTGRLNDLDIQAAYAQNPLTLALDLIAKREGFLRGIVRGNPSQQKFLTGWLNRTRDLKQLVKTL